ncbi:response regulator [Caballeronia sp. 15711]|uniref:response regulator n=1 Tax=Caballeronia sp. 15711 TaxID=3391029 RepID=UPI0039E488DA
MPSNVIKAAAHPWIRRSFNLDGMPLRLLVVDDNQNAAVAMASYLSFESMDCRVAFGGLDAIEIGTNWAPHVILMDISMPECNGYEATFALRQDRRTSGEIKSNVVFGKFGLIRRQAVAEPVCCRSPVVRL